MKTKTFLLTICTAALVAACSQKQSVVTVPVSHIDVEKLLDSIDYNMDVSALGVGDLRVLRNAPAARQGFPFKDAYVRGIYESTTWYDSLMWQFDESLDFSNVKEKEGESWRDHYYRAADETEALKYSDEEQAFMKRLKEREDELLKLNFDVAEGQRVNVGNLINPRQLKDFDSQLCQQLAQNGFAIVPANHEQLFHIYEKNDYNQFPSFVTTDLYLQLYHLYVDCMLRELEEQKLMSLLKEFCEEGQKTLAKRLIREKENEDEGLYDTPGATEWLVTYFKVANALLEEQAPKNDADALGEYERVMKSENANSEFLGYTDVLFEYSLFRPRGHYTRNDNLKRYFRTMMWLQTVPFRTDVPFDMLKANILAVEVCDDLDNPRLYTLYKKLTEPMNFLMGQPDDVSIEQVNKIISDIATCEIDPNELGKKVDEIAEKQTRIRPKFQRTGRNKVRLMPQRYQPDAEVLLEMVDYDSKPTKRATPKGLDVMAAMGISAAEQVLIDEQQQWKDFGSQLKKMKQRMTEIDWNETIATQWLNTLKVMNTDKPADLPYFMVTPEWQLKDLNAALASWAELKHDAILYAKQPMGAECGGAGPPDPVVKGYVEPNTAFWKKAIELLDNTANLLKEQNMMTEKIANATQRISEELQFLLRVSEKELAGQEATDEEYDQMQYIGATFENISLDLIREPDQYLMGWSDVQGADRKVALVADVYTANADNNPDKSILFEAVGGADEIYVVVELDGCLYLTRGAVLSYREFTQPIGQPRLTDEEWQQQLEKNPRKGVPEWINRIIVPLKQQPAVNEEVFYSSGC